MTGSKPGEIFDHITNLLEDFENEDTDVEKSNINSENSTEDAYNTVIKVKFLNLNSNGFLGAEYLVFETPEIWGSSSLDTQHSHYWSDN